MRNLRTGLGPIPFEGIEPILRAAAELSEEQYLAPGEFPHGGVRGTLVHALFAEWMWRMRWQGTALSFLNEGPRWAPTKPRAPSGSPEVTG
jgi:hypothetical protein